MESISFSITALDILLIVLTFLLVFLGIVGCIIPGIAGTPLCWGGMLASYFVEPCKLSLATLIVCAVITVLVEVVNNFVPSFFTIKAGGSRAGFLGAIVGTFAGLFLGGFIGILAGPFVGAFIGELIHDRSDVKRAIKSAAFAFLGFVTGTGLRLIVACGFVIVLIHAYWAK